jgi:hypothetical protein
MKPGVVDMHSILYSLFNSGLVSFSVLYHKGHFTEECKQGFVCILIFNFIKNNIIF